MPAASRLPRDPTGGPVRWKTPRPDRFRSRGESLRFHPLSAVGSSVPVCPFCRHSPLGCYSLRILALQPRRLSYENSRQRPAQVLTGWLTNPKRPISYHSPRLPFEGTTADHRSRSATFRLAHCSAPSRKPSWLPTSLVSTPHSYAGSTFCSLPEGAFGGDHRQPNRLLDYPSRPKPDEPPRRPSQVPW